MRGIVLAGGTGSRLGVVTRAVNKHLLLVSHKPMIYWPLKVLEDNNIDDITIVSTPRGVGQLAEMLGGGYTYRVQEGPGGISQAIHAAGDNNLREQVAVVLGDNVFLPSPDIQKTLKVGGAWCYLRGVPASHLSEFGVPTFDEDGIIVRIDEKPTAPASCFAVTGLYLFGADVFGKVVGRSARGEAEVTDLLNLYARDGMLEYSVLDGFWGDAGTPSGMRECTIATDGWSG